ncbi:hypothetical protein HDV03_000450 [Kappamyces sp. JEL0829]|nr:hypothetical protein HDV03_000450 [Kappamyces sp. JEL0829]
MSTGFYCCVCLEGNLAAPLEARIQPCLHCFCLDCIKGWVEMNSAASPQCPLCKVPISAILYDFRRPDDFLTMDVSDIGAVAGASSSESGSRSPAFRSETDTRQRVRACESGHLSLRSRAGRKSGAFGRQPKWEPTSPWLQQRRNVYRLGMASRKPSFTSSSKVPSFDPGYLQKNPRAVATLQEWIERDLSVLLGSRLVADISVIVVDVLRRIDVVKDSAGALSVLVPLLQGDASLFLHELVCYGASSLDLASYDRYAAVV